MRVLAIDFETANERRDSACALGVAWIEDGRVVATEEHLIRPREMRFLPMNTAIHGIRAEDVADAPSFAELWRELGPRMEGALVLAHNAAFDLSVLRHTLADHGLGHPSCAYLCTVIVARRAWPELSRHRLDTLADHLGLALDHHRAGSDAEACGRIALAAAGVLGAARVAEIPAVTGIAPGRLTPDGYSACRAGTRQAARRRRAAALP
ncbi:3'-5' exonuclease [Azospirillum sp. RWY-5-1]|uniref:3'-5' exonuclease n=1 Tax=Azospirillum oleiclasticum TaxID=2735135 RepID=A0ABX2TL09_9PROT|nr:3'-5' exonuclease [Azospirillum oleiclasticum]NYZ16292.1 3'-5' exonuclease [Azospirillum oleiclasticum]NYZ23779.1 3'-5' exonuclease [Azospirillum oleiclasticum]